MGSNGGLTDASSYRDEATRSGEDQLAILEIDGHRVALPERAVNFDADGASIMVLGADQRVHRQKIRTGARSEGFVQLLEGPPAGSQVVLGGAAFLLDGDKVRVAGAGAK